MHSIWWALGATDSRTPNGLALIDGKPDLERKRKKIKDVRRRPPPRGEDLKWPVLELTQLAPNLIAIAPAPVLRDIKAAFSSDKEATVNEREQETRDQFLALPAHEGFRAACRPSATMRTRWKNLLVERAIASLQLMRDLEASSGDMVR